MVSISRHNEKKTNVFCLMAVFFVLGWTIWHSFLGIDMVDTGYYYYQYLHPRADNVSYSTYLATLIGGLWIRVFPKLGLWGLNILELILEYILCVVVYKTFKDTFRKSSIIIALVFCMLAISTYVNVFNYHQLSMFLCTTMLCAMYIGLNKGKPVFHFFAGGASLLAILTRFPCVLTLVCLLCIVYYYVFIKPSLKKMIRDIVVFLAGFITFMLIVGFMLNALGVLTNVVNDVFRISNLGSSGGASYGVSNQVRNLIFDTLNSVEAALMFGLCALAISAGIYAYFSIRFDENKTGLASRAIIYLPITAVLINLGLFGSYFAMYRVGRAPNFIQLTSFSWYMYGMLFVTGLSFLILGITVSVSKERTTSKILHNCLVGSRAETIMRDSLIALMGIALVLLSFVGSAARSKHAILGMWFIVPLVIDRIFDVVDFSRRQKTEKRWLYIWVKSSVFVVVTIFLVAFGWFVMNTNNFDDPNIFALNAEIDSDKLRFLKTTDREADAVNEVLAIIDDNVVSGDTLLVIGNPIMFYALTDLEAYVRPWVTGSSYLFSELEMDIGNAESKGKPYPVIIDAKTNPYAGFSKETYQSQIEDVNRTNERSEKVQFIRGFMEERGYKKLYENDYFIVWSSK